MIGPDYVIPYLAQLQQLAQTDDNDVVRIHCLGAVRATEAEANSDLPDPATTGMNYEKNRK